MQIFLDESGDCGMRDRRSADYFAVTAVCLHSADAVAVCDHQIQELRESLGLVESYEFHFVRVKDKHRREFLKHMAHCPFTFAACLVDKTKLHGEHWQDKAFFYEKVIHALVEGIGVWIDERKQLKEEMTGGNLIYDDNGDPVFALALREQCKRLQSAKGKALVKKIRPGRSRSSNLIQLADMITGAAVRWHHDGDDSFWKLIRKRGLLHQLF